MKRFAAQCFMFVFLALTLSGCGRLIDYGKRTFYQGEQLNGHAEKVCPYIRSKTVYDQFTTRAIFDALWLSPPVRTAYADLHAHVRGKSEEHHRAFLRRQIEETNHFIVFYVLSLYEVPLDEENPQWTVFLQINGQTRVPIELKAIDLPNEYKVFFGKRLSRFKSAYEVKFNARDIEDDLLITPETKEIALYFRSTDKQIVLSWQLNKLEKTECT